jgi:hypothetical protein
MLSVLQAPQPRLERALAMLLVVFYAGLAALYVALDSAAGVSLHPWYGLAYALVGSLPGLVIVARGRPRAAIAALALFALLIAAAPALDFSDRKPFLREAGRIRAGMTVDEVDRRMARFERFPAAPGALEGGAVTFRNHYAPGDTDSVTVTFADGQVVASEVLLD